MSNDYIHNETVCIEYVRANIKPWTAKDGSQRFYIPVGILNEYREASGNQLNQTYDWVNERASWGRVRAIIEGNILPNTKAYIDENGQIHVYGWAATGKGADMGLDKAIAHAIAYFYAPIDERTKERRAHKIIGKSGDNAIFGDTVKVVRGRKEVGKEFIVSKKTEYYYSSYRAPSVYLYDSDGFKVNADNCDIITIGYTRARN